MSYHILNKEDLFKAHQNAGALLFTDQGILADASSHDPLLPLQDTLAKLSAHVEAAYLLDSTIVVKCATPLTSEQLMQVRLQIHNVKPFLSTVDHDLQQIILKAYHCLQWDRQSQYCGQCGRALAYVVDSTEKKCAACKVSFFPRFSPAVIVAIKKQHQILLARSPHFNQGMYSVIAGFVDLGETAEMAIHREIKEEIGIQITNIRYVGSQTWPFPDSFMLAFQADYLSGDIKIDRHEIEDAKWFSKDALPLIPGKASIARTLIDEALGVT